MYPHHLAHGMAMGHMPGLMGGPPLHPRMHMLARGPHPLAGGLPRGAAGLAQVNLVPTPVRPRAHFRPSPGSSPSVPAMVCIHCGTLVQSNHSHQLKRHLGTCRYLPAPVRQLLDAAARERASRMEGVYGNNAVYRQFQVVGWLRSVCNACGMEVRGDSSKLGRHLGMCKADKSRGRDSGSPGNAKAAAGSNPARRATPGSASGAAAGSRKRPLTVAKASGGGNGGVATVATGGGAPESPAVVDGDAVGPDAFKEPAGSVASRHSDDDGPDDAADAMHATSEQGGLGGGGDPASATAPGAQAQNDVADAPARQPGPRKRRRLRQRTASTRYARETRAARKSASPGTESDEEQGKGGAKGGPGVKFEFEPAQHFTKKAKCRYCSQHVASSQPNHLKRHLGNCRKVPPRVVRDLDADAVLHAAGSVAQATLFNVVGFMSSVCRVCGCMVRGDTYKVRKHRAKCAPPADSASTELMPSTCAAPMLVPEAPSTSTAAGEEPAAATPAADTGRKLRRTPRRRAEGSPPTQWAAEGDAPASGAPPTKEAGSRGDGNGTSGTTSGAGVDSVKQESSAQPRVPSPSEDDAVAMLVGRFASGRTNPKDTRHPGAATPMSPVVAGAPGGRPEPDAVRTLGGDAASGAPSQTGSAGRAAASGQADGPADWHDASARAGRAYGWGQDARGAAAYGARPYAGDWPQMGMGQEYGPEYPMQAWQAQAGMHQHQRAGEGQPYAGTNSGGGHSQEAMVMRVQQQMWAARERMAYQMRQQPYGAASMYYAHGGDGAFTGRGYGPAAPSNNPDAGYARDERGGSSVARDRAASAGSAPPARRGSRAEDAARVAFAAATQQRQAGMGGRAGW